MSEKVDFDMEKCEISNLYDEVPSLKDLLEYVDKYDMCSTIKKLNGGVFFISDIENQIVMGEKFETVLGKKPILLEFEEIGVFHSYKADIPDAVFILINSMINISHKYLMASSIHTEVLHADYEELKNKNMALQESEIRYRQLVKSLEEKVNEQVKDIEKKRQQIYINEKQAAIGQLAAGIAHEINTPLGYIKSNLNYSKDSLDEISSLVNKWIRNDKCLNINECDELKEIINDFNEILNENLYGIDNIAQIINDLKVVSNIDRTDFIVINVNDLISSCIRVFNASHKCSVIFEKDKLNANVSCHPALISQVIIAVLTNSYQAIPEDGYCTIVLESDAKDLTINIEDNGCGISKENIDKIFDPFFTTHDVGSGKGLGLSTCLEIIGMHGGEMEVCSEVGEGTVVKIVLPFFYDEKK